MQVPISYLKNIDSNDIELIGDKEYIVFNNGNMQVITVTENNR